MPSTNAHPLAAEVVECRRLLEMSKSARATAALQAELDALLAELSSDLEDARRLRGLASSDEAKKLLDAQIAALGEQMSATPEKKPAAAPAPSTTPPSTKPPSTKAASKEKKAAASKPRRPPPPSADAAREDEDDDDDGSEVDGTDSESGILSDPEETAAQEERLELRVAKLRRKRGEAHDSTLKHTFKLLDCLIGQYKLNRVDAVLAEIADVCHAAKGRGASDWHVKYIQALAFCRWKQHRFKEALELFYQQQEIVGASSALCENIGHTLSSLGDLPKAEEYFERAIELLKHGSFGNRGGIYMGLGLVRERLGKQKEALPILEQALEHYQKEHTKGHATVDSSIIAKAHMSIGKVRPAQFSAQFSAQFLRAILTPCPSALQVHEKLNELPLAARHMAEALRIFRATVGETSPLTAHAMSAYGRVRFAQGPAHNKEAKALLKGALKLEVCAKRTARAIHVTRPRTFLTRPTPCPSISRQVAKDAFHLESVWEVLNRLKDLHMEEAKADADSKPRTRDEHLGALRSTYAPYLPLIAAARGRLTAAHEKDELGTLAVFYKTTGEICCLAQAYEDGEELLEESLRLLAKVDNFDVSSLVDGCNSLLSIAQANNPRLSEVGNGEAGPSGA